ncbi:P-loop NTPase family protein, partial [Staphylococcus epidermidis]|uniref:hypothetical protein n=1 Tax=Staphylococcus epidermidis TaxID=1282 RepID=UPI0021B3AAF7
LTYKGKNIPHVLQITVQEATHFFQNIPNIKPKLQTLLHLRFPYITLPQQPTTLSPPQPQHLKLPSQFHKPSTPPSIYILHQPTTPLHLHDI